MVAVFIVYVLTMCFVWLFQIMVLTCSDVTWIFPIAWQNGQKGKKKNWSQAHCSIKYIVQYSLQMMHFLYFCIFLLQ